MPYSLSNPSIAKNGHAVRRKISAVHGAAAKKISSFSPPFAPNANVALDNPVEKQ
jgi:hypothetical protein